ncbi:MAG: hypothetical protein JKY08_08965 [Flavobacteriaceae bacterium]|nr:hypothetical protein [Flavobacteriaceae bacterium]
MKQVFYTFAILIVSLISCDKNSDNEINIPETPKNDNILPVKLEITNPNGEIETQYFTYSGMRLIKDESSKGFYTDYIYEDNKITEINFYDEPNPAILESYTYDTQGRVATISTKIVGVGVYEYNQTYNADNSVITQSTIGYPDDIPTTTTISNGNITNDTEEYYISSTYTYDTKNGIFKNVELREIFITISSENGYPHFFNLNNCLGETIKNDSTKESEHYTYTITYTSFDYPRTIKQIDKTGTTLYTCTFTYNND